MARGGQMLEPDPPAVERGLLADGTECSNLRYDDLGRNLR